MFKIQAHQIADSIDIKAFRASCTLAQVYADSDELFYKTGDNQFIYVFRYGVVCFANLGENERAAFIKDIGKYCKNFSDYKLNDEIIVENNGAENRFGHNKIVLQNASGDAIRIIMLNVSQSVALDYYSEQTERLILDSDKHTQFLEKRGKLDISGSRLKRFIGKTINLRNRINENLYIFDSLPETWENEDLYKIDMEMKKIFDLQSRYRNIQEELEIIKENLSLLIDLMHQRRSSFLEIVVIALILVEVINLIVEKFFHL
jgi:uncharacterized Rmd1/YagE family protein